MILFSYFLLVIGIGVILLSLPVAWAGEGRLSFIDALFTSVSAVCVTGLITVDTASYSLFGKVVIMLLIQFGGLGILTFTTVIFLSATRTKKVSLRNLQMVKSFYLDSIEFKAHHILKNILLLTFSIELLGALLLYLRFRSSVEVLSWFYALFTSVSAFCNAGFSLFSDSLAGYATDPFLLSVVMLLLVTGGLGFLIFNDIYRLLRREKKHLSLHTKIVLITTGGLILSSTLLYFLLEGSNSLEGMSLSHKLVNALFQAVTPRTAGFNVIDQASLSAPSKVLTILLMFIGGSPASIAGGIKTTTFAIVLLAILKEPDCNGRLKLGNRMVSQSLVNKAMLFLGKAVGILVVSIFLLTLTQMRAGSQLSFFSLLFEAVSAFGTVGLSTGVTAGLSSSGKLIIIATMFAGRVGLISLTIPLFKEREDAIDYPEEEVLVG